MSLLSVRGLTKSFKGEAAVRIAVSDLSFDLACGEILAFLGANGAGKTTTIKMVAALIKPDHGSVSICGLNPYKHPHCLAFLGAILESNRNTYWRLSPLENIDYFAGLRGIRRTEAHARGTELLDRFGLKDRINTPVANLSRGMQQKIAIILALIHRPKLLLLDEPTLGLDLESSSDMKQIVQQLATEGIGILLTTHQLALAEALAHNLLILKEGRKVLHCPLHEALRNTNDRVFSISLLSQPSWAQQHKLGELGAKVDGSLVNFTGDSLLLYAILDALRPLEVDEIKTSARSLDDVFLEIACDEYKSASIR